MNYGNASSVCRLKKPAYDYCLLLLSLIFTFSFILSGCKDSPDEPPVSNRWILTSTSWRVTKALDVGSVPGQAIDVTSQNPMAYLTFISDGKFSSSVISGTWELTNEEKKITIYSSAFSAPITADILEISKSLLRLKMTIPAAEATEIVEVTLVPLDRDTSPEYNFDTLWKEFDTRYSFFEIKKINWDSVYSVFRPRVKAETPGIELFQTMSSMLNILKDGHVNLQTPYGNFAYSGWYQKYPKNFISAENITKYLSRDYGTLAQGYIHYGKIGENIGYIYIGPNLMGSDADWTQAIDMIIDSLKNTKGIVIDIRNNGGGNDGLGRIVASRFYDRQRTYSYISWRSGPKHTDFTQPQPSTVQPAGKQRYLKPVAFLTNRHCFSSAEGTTLMFRVLPNVTTIGDTTGGGSANPISLQLPNGWNYTVSRWIQYTSDMQIFEGKGLPPQIPVGISEEDMKAGKDAILEYAVSYLNSK